MMKKKEPFNFRPFPHAPLTLAALAQPSNPHRVKAPCLKHNPLFRETVSQPGNEQILFVPCFLHLQARKSACVGDGEEREAVCVRERPCVREAVREREAVSVREAVCERERL